MLWFTALILDDQTVFIEIIPVLHWTRSVRDLCFVTCSWSWCVTVQVKVAKWWRWVTVKIRSEMSSVCSWRCCCVTFSLRRCSGDELHVRFAGREEQKILVEQRRFTELPSITSVTSVTSCWSLNRFTVGLGGDSTTHRDAVKHYRIIISNNEGTYCTVVDLFIIYVQ